MQWAEIEHRGERWLVASRYIAPVSIGQALALARANGAELPTKDLVDAIWRAADLKVEPVTMSPNRGADPRQHAQHAAAVEAAIGGRPFALVAGTHKDIAICANGRAGLYGWHRRDGRIIQDCNTSAHDHAYLDYSQGVRLVKRVTGERVALDAIVSGAIAGAAGGLAFGVHGAIVGAIVGAVVEVKR